MKIFRSFLEKETETYAKKIASKLKGAETLALFGDLGAGKTAFTRGIADFFDLKNQVSSPTFAIMNEYKNEKMKINHFDMYRVNSYEDLESTGFFECLKDGITIIEWSENIKEFLPENVIKIFFEKTKNENERIVKIENFSN